MSEQMKMGPEAHASADTIIRDSGPVSANHLIEIEFLNTTRSKLHCLALRWGFSKSRGRFCNNSTSGRLTENAVMQSTCRRKRLPNLVRLGAALNIVPA